MVKKSFVIFLLINLIKFNIGNEFDKDLDDDAYEDADDNDDDAYEDYEQYRHISSSPICNMFRNTNEQNTPIKAEVIKKWNHCLNEFNTSHIYSVKEIYEFLRILSLSPYGHIKLQNLTLKDRRARNVAITFKGNYIPYVNISTGSYIQKPAIVIVGGIYGRDWLTVAATLFIIKELVINNKKNEHIITKSTWIIVPLLNPDGYNETRHNKKNRNWIKNMVRTKDTKDRNCFGVNLYRNFEYQWINYDYANTSWCEKEYSSKPFSEVESKSIRDTIVDNLDTIKIYVTLIQTQRAFWYPFAFTSQKPANSSLYEEILEASTKAATRLNNRFFDYGHASKFRKKYAGGPSDWIKSHLLVEMSFTCGISDWINNYKNLSVEEIHKTNDETFAALTIIASLGTDFVESNYKYISFASRIFSCGVKKMYYLLIIIYFLINESF